MSAPEATVAARRESLLSRFRRFRKGPWEGLATVIIAAGVIMLMQSFSIDLYGWSFATLLVGTGMFLVVSHFPE